MDGQRRLSLTEAESKYPQYEELLMLKARVDAAADYYGKTEYPQPEIMAVILGFDKTK